MPDTRTAHQIADVTRTTSSSALLVDSMTKKLNQHSEELIDAKQEIHALKAHLSRLAVGDGPSKQQQQQQQPTQSQAHDQEQKRSEDKQRRHAMTQEIVALVKDEVEHLVNTKHAAVEDKLETMDVSLMVNKHDPKGLVM